MNPKSQPRKPIRFTERKPEQEESAPEQGVLATPKSTPERIFVKGLNWVGDAIMGTPAISLLRETWPEAKITLMARPWVAAIYEHNPDIDELLIHDDATSWREFYKAVRKVRKGRFQLGLALPNSIRSALLLRWGGVLKGVGYGIGARRTLLTQPITLDPHLLETHQVYYYLHLVEQLTEKKVKAPRLVLKAGEIERQEIDRMLTSRGLDLGRPMVGLAPGSINSNAKRWPAERYGELVGRLATGLNADIVLLGSESERDVLTRVESNCKASVHNFCGQMGLGQAIALNERLDGLICNDSGAMHMAAALGVPTVAVFGPTEWDTTYPFSDRAKIVREDVDCAPCMLRECPQQQHLCMEAVTAERVAETFMKLYKTVNRSDEE